MVVEIPMIEEAVTIMKEDGMRIQVKTSASKHTDTKQEMNPMASRKDGL